MLNNSPTPVQHVFGPVPSRRLGRSLGVDLVPYKVCSLDCIYCQVGRTTNKTIARKIFVPVGTILSEIREKLKAGPRPDVITLAGSGEPTLHAALGDIIAGIKQMTDIPVAVLTNGTLLSHPAVRTDCRQADMVLPSLDAGDEETFQLINRPAEGVSLEQLVHGLEVFREEYSGHIWLEIFFVAGLNATPEHAQKIRALVDRIRPDRIQLNTAVRPTADDGVRALTPDALSDLCALMGPKAEVIADFKHVDKPHEFAAKVDDVLAMIQRRPVTVDDIAAGLGIHSNEAVKLVEELLKKELVVRERREGREFLRAP